MGEMSDGVAAPTRPELFCALCAVACAKGRGRALFGDGMADARAAFERCLISEDFPATYLEFPLSGEPCLDMLALYDRVERGARFAPGAGFGHQPVFDWFADVSAEMATPVGMSCPLSIGLELDLSQGEHEHAGIYLQQARATELVRPFLAHVGAASRADAYGRVARRMPRGWDASYVGLFPARPGTPMRLGGYLTEPSRRRCAADPAFLASRLEMIGFGATNDAMVALCAELMGLAPAIDFQFDITPEGTLGDTFGLSLSFGRCLPGAAAACFSSGYGAAIMGRLEDLGLADDRWRLIPGITFARRINHPCEGGSTDDLVASVRLNYAKVKFVGGVAQAAKFYVVASVRRMRARP